MKEKNLKRNQERSCQKSYPVIQQIPRSRRISELALKEEKKLWLTMCCGIEDKPKSKYLFIAVYMLIKFRTLRLGRLRSNKPK